MSQRQTPTPNGFVVTVDATNADETVPLTRQATDRRAVVRRKDSVSARTVTVAVTSGLTLDGVTNGTTTVGPDSEKEFVSVDGGWESFGSGGDAAKFAADITAAVAEQAEIDATLYPRVSTLARNALDAGLVGDGVTDDTTHARAWVADLANNHREGYWPAGNYLISDQLDIPRTYGWVIRGAGTEVTTITQATDNKPIFNLGSDTASSMHSWELSGLGLTYANFQPAANTLANPILFSQMGYEGVIEKMAFNRGSYAMRVASGIGCPWGTKFDDLQFRGSLSLGAMDWSAGANGVPNNKFGRMLVDCSSIDSATPGVFLIRGYNFVIDEIEFIGAAHGPKLMLFAASSEVSIGALKLEVGTYATSTTLFDFNHGCKAHIGQLNIGGNPMVVSAAYPGVTILGAGSGGSNPGRVTVGSLAAGASSAITGAGYAISCSASNPVHLGHVELTDGWLFQNAGGTTSAESLMVDRWVNNHLSSDKGDANYTISLGDANVVTFQTPFTAPRTVTLPGTVPSNLHNGLYYDIITNGAVNGANTLAITCNGTTLRTETNDKRRIRFTWRRHASSVAAGWVMTAYDTLP